MPWIAAVLATVVFVWAVLLFLDSLLRSCQNYPYIWLMDRAGIQLKLGQIRWTTQKCNRLFVWLGSRRPRLLRLWYNAGAISGCVLVIPAVLILIITIKNNVFPAEDESGQHKEQLIGTVLPGVNLPTSEIPFYIITLVFCIIVHELGHALAAVREEVRVLGCGLTVIGVLPAAFVDISTDQVQLMSPWRQLRVFCAGIWHNVILAIIAAIFLLLSPFLLSFGYTNGSGVAVRQVNEMLPSGLSVRDHVTAVNGCPIADFTSWYNCLYKTATAPQVGYCVPNTFLEGYQWNTSGLGWSSDVIDCCASDDAKGVCFAWINPSLHRQKVKSYSCLPARKVLKVSLSGCFSEEECEVSASCIIPAIDNVTRLMQISRNGQDDALYICEVHDLYYAVSVSNYVPKFWFCPCLLPYILEMLLKYPFFSVGMALHYWKSLKISSNILFNLLFKYLISFSGALALLNAVPCHSLDGQWICAAIVELLLSNGCDRRTRVRLTSTLVTLGTIILTITVLTGINNIL